MVKITIEEADASHITDTFARNQRYLYQNRSDSERAQSGYLTMSYSPEALRQVLRYESIVVAKVDGRIAGHYYPMPDYFRPLIAELSPKLEIFEKVQYQGRPIATYRYFEIVQILVEGQFQRMGLARKLVEDALRRTRGQYELLLVKIAEGNERSVKFHTSVGFKLFDIYKAPKINLLILGIDLRPAAKL